MGANSHVVPAGEGVRVRNGFCSDLAWTWTWVLGLQHIDEVRAVGVLADEGLVRLDDGVVTVPIAIHLPAVGHHNQV